MRPRIRGRSVRVRTAVLLVILATPLCPAPASGQEPHGIEAGMEAITTLAHSDFVGSGAAFAFRPGGRVRMVLAAAPGVARNRLAVRGELLGQLMLRPGLRHGVGFYGLAGIAGQAGARDAGWLVLGLGMEGTPAARSGWHLEAGVGGGVRIAAGWRWRWLRFPRAGSP